VSNSQIHYGTTSSTWENYDTVINSAEMVTGHSVTLTGLSPETTYYFRTGSTDALNNGPQVSNEFSFTTQRETDLSRPVITKPPTVTAVTERSATIEWQTDEPSDSEVRYGTKKAKWERYPFVYTDKQMVTAHRVTVTGLAAEEIYYFMVGSTDASGNQPNTSPSEKNNPFSQDTFTTEKIPDTAAPVIISEPTVTSFDSTTATVEWVTDEPSNSSVFYIKSDALGSATADEFLLSSEEESAMVTKHLVTITNLDPGEEYTFLASSVDKDGNGPGLEESAENLSSALELTTKKDPDHFAPVISDVTMMYATDTTAIITWQTDEPSNSVVKFGPVSADWSDYAKTESDGEMTTRHAVTITGLVPDTRYYFSVASTDAFGNGPFYNSNASNPHMESYFTTAAYPDNEAPEMPSVIKITTNAPERSAVVTWTTKEPGSSQVRYDTTSKGWEGYRFSENDAELVRSHSVTLTNLEVGTVYFVRVSSVDAAGNNYEVSNYDMNPSREFNFVMEGIGEMDYTASSETGEEGTATCFIQSTRAEMPGGQFVVTILLMVLAAFVVTVARQRK